jgi:hypothetical protein
VVEVASDAKCAVHVVAMEVGKCGCGRGGRPHHCGRTSPSRHCAHPFSRLLVSSANSIYSCFFFLNVFLGSSIVHGLDGSEGTGKYGDVI